MRALKFGANNMPKMGIYQPRASQLFHNSFIPASQLLRKVVHRHGDGGKIPRSRHPHSLS
jgi:hypothetical protein